MTVPESAWHLCRRIAESHGGTIVLDTEYRDGARFVVRLPVGGNLTGWRVSPIRPALAAARPRSMSAPGPGILKADLQPYDRPFLGWQRDDAVADRLACTARLSYPPQE
jgi:hypothetical protein